MSRKTISELTDGEDTRTDAAVVAFEEGGAAFKGSIRPNPNNTHYVKNQAQLEAALGTDLIIPVNTSVTIVIDESMVLTKPFKQQQDSSLLLMSESSNVTLQCLDKAIVMDNPGSDVGKRLEIDNLTIAGTTLNTALEVQESEFFTIHQAFLAGFANLGFVKDAFVVCREYGALENGTGIDFINNPFVDIIGFSGENIGDFYGKSITLFNFIGTNRTDVVIQNARHSNPNRADNLIFFDPNSDPGSSLSVVRSGVIPVLSFFELLFQKGTDMAATAAGTGAAPGSTVFAIPGHSLVVGQYVVLKNFLVETAYNGTFVVTGVTSPSSVDIDVPFTAPDVGTMNASSLLSTNIRVSALRNPDQPDSMFTGDAGLELVAPITATIVSQDLAVPINNANWAYNNLERFEEDLVTINEGRLIAKDFSKRRYTVTYSATINRSGGGGVNIGIVLIKNGVFATPVSFNPPRAFTTAITFMTRTEIVSLEENDVLQLAVINYDGTANIDVYQGNVSVNRG